MNQLLSAKQHLYQRMLMKVTDYRGLASLEVLTTEDKEWLKELAFQADLLHGIPWGVTHPDFRQEDFDFLNRHARYYISAAPKNGSNYRFFKLMIHQLFELVPQEAKSQLQWSGPDLDDTDKQILAQIPV
jgi:hypothetical protein